MPDAPLKVSARRWFVLALLVLIADQLSKWLVVYTVPQESPLVVTSFFNVVHVYNSGASFSFLADRGGWQRWFFLVIALAVGVWIVRYIRQHGQQQLLFCCGLSLILGGAIGNALDRVSVGAVIDFIQVHWQNRWYYPAFNVADSAITVGALLSGVAMWRAPN